MTQGYEYHSHTVPSMKLYQEWNVCKAQEHHIKDKLVADLGRSDKEHGLTYIDLSRATIFGDFGIFNGITRSSLINSVFQQKK